MATLFYLFLNDSYFVTQEKYFIIFQIVIMTIILPILFVFLLHAIGKVDSLLIPEASQRIIPLIIQSFLIILLLQKSITIDRYPELHFFFLGSLSSTVQALVLLFFKIKASLHMLAISALTVFVIGLSLHFQIYAAYWIVFLILMNGFVASSRLEMKAHSPTELTLGFLLGSIPQLLLFYYWL